MDRIFGILVSMVISTGGNTSELPVKETVTCESAAETLKPDGEALVKNKLIIEQDEKH